MVADSGTHPLLLGQSERAADESHIEGRTSILFLKSSDGAFGADRILVSAVDAALRLAMSVRVLLPDATPRAG